MFHLLRTGDNAGIAHSRTVSVAHNGFAFIDDPLHAFARFALRLFVVLSEDLLQPRHVATGFFQVMG